jgi:hypothetical protein
VAEGAGGAGTAVPGVAVAVGRFDSGVALGCVASVGSGGTSVGVAVEATLAVSAKCTFTVGVTVAIVSRLPCDCVEIDAPDAPPQATTRQASSVIRTAPRWIKLDTPPMFSPLARRA